MTHPLSPELRALGTAILRMDGSTDSAALCDKAADALDAQAAENERLRDLLSEHLSEQSQAWREYEALRGGA